MVVSEERGEVTLVHDRQWWQPAIESELLELLTLEHCSPAPRAKPPLHGVLFGNLRQKLSALVITGLVWALSLLSSGTAIRDLTVPVEFTNLPAGLDVSRPSTRQVEVRVRGPRWQIESLRASGLSVRFDLSNAHPGATALSHPSDVVSLPAGVAVEKVRPEVITVNIISTGNAGSP